MSSVNNLNINEKALKSKKKFKIVKTVAVVVLAASLIVGGIFGYKYYTDAKDQNQIQTIETYYGEDSKEGLILDYIEVADKLNTLNLEKYDADSALYEKHGCSTELMKPEEIEKLVTKFGDIGSSVSTKDLNVLSDNIYTILNLKKQEQLVNKYIYSIGYETAYNNITEATKKYAGEVFGVEDYGNLKFRYNSGGNTGESSVLMTNTIDKQYGLDEVQNYNFASLFRSEEENKIQDGVISMIKTDKNNDKNDEDNNSYNLDRNKYIKEALEQSVILTQEVEENDLYNEKLAGKLK